MESIKLALQSLNKGISQSKNKASPDIEVAIIKLSAVLQLLPEDTLRDEAFLKLSDLLRHTIQPLYRQNLDLTLNFSSAVYSALQTLKVSPAKFVPSRTVWEMIQSSILSGLLDHLDDHRTVKVKGPICQAFFPSLCKLYFPTTAEGRLDAHSDLITTACLILVFMLMSELVCGHAAGATGFRKVLNGGRRLGYTILSMRDFLPLEAVLELFANLLFSFKNGKSDRVKFIQDVFNPGLFHSPQLVSILAKVTSPSVWESVSSEVINIISSSDIAFPQPIDVSNFELRGLQTDNVDRLYIESTSIVLSIPADEGDDTLVIPFRHVVELRISPNEEDVSVSLTLNKPPVIGKKPLVTEHTIIQCRWRLERGDLSRLLNSLKYRKVPFKSSGLDSRRKLSIAEAISLDLSSDAGPPKPTQEKVITIAKLWDGQSLAADNVTTSPLLHAIFPPKSDELNAVPLLDESTVFVDGKGNFADQPTQHDRKLDPDSSPLEAAQAKASKDDLLKRSLSLLMSASNQAQEDANDIESRTARQRKTHRNIVSVDDSEATDGDVGDQDYAPSSPTPSRRRSPRLNRVSRTPGLPKIPEGKVLPGPDVVGRENAPVKDAKPRLAVRTRSAHNKENAGPAKAEPLKSLKRPASPSLVVASDDEPPLPPAKKLRRSPEKEKEKPKARPTTRYKSKIKVSTPAIIDLADGDKDDEPPKVKPGPNVKIAARKRAAETQGAGKKSTQMKDRSGNAKPRPISVPVNKRTTRATADEKMEAKDEDKDTEMEDATPASNILKQVELASKHPSVVKAESNPAELGATTPHRKTKESKPSSRKPREAVWQRDSFQANLKAQEQSTPVRRIASEEESDPISVADEWPLHDASKVESESRLPPVVQTESSEDPIDIVSDDVDGGLDTLVTEPPFAEYYVPVKGNPETSPFPSEPALVKEEPEDVIMIDLTSSPKGSGPASPIPMHVRSSTPPPAPVKRSREEVGNVLDLKRPQGPVLAPALRFRRQQPSNQSESREPPKVKSGRKQVVNVIGRGNVESEFEKSPVLVKAEVVEQHEPRKSEGEYGFESAPPTTNHVLKPIDRIVQQYQVPSKPAHIQHRQRTKDEERRQKHRLPVPPTQTRSEQKATAYLKQQRVTGEVPKDRYEIVKSVSSVRKEVRTKEPIADITEVLREIQEALADRLSNRFEETRQEMTQAQLALLGQAADDLTPMAREAEEHFNALVDLEAEYGTHRRKIMTGVDAFRKSTTQLTGALKQVVQNHNRNSLAKKFPAKLSTKPPARFDSDWRF